jgi:MFS family permease
MAKTRTADGGVLSPGDQVVIYSAAYLGHGASRMMGIVVPLWVVTLDPSAILIGFALGARHLPSLFLSIPSGALMDRMGVRRVVMATALLGVVVPPLYPALPSVSVVIVLQMIFGYVTTISWLGVQTLVGQITKGDPVHAGRLTIANQLGNLTVPPVIGMIWDYLGPWEAFLSMSLFEGLLLLFAMRMPDITRAVTPGKSGAPARDWKPRFSDYTDAFKLLGIPAVLLVVLISVLDNCSGAINQSFYVVYLESFGLSGTLIGVLFAVSSLMSITGSLMAGPIGRRVNHHWLLLVMIGSGIMLLVITPLLGFYSLLLLAAGAKGLFQGVAHPFVLSVMSRSVGPEAQGKAIGLRTTGNRIVGAVVPVLMGFIAEGAGVGNSFLIMGVVFAAFIVAIAVYILRTPAFRK